LGQTADCTTRQEPNERKKENIQLRILPEQKYHVAASIIIIITGDAGNVNFLRREECGKYDLITKYLTRKIYFCDITDFLRATLCSESI